MHYANWYNRNENTAGGVNGNALNPGGKTETSRTDYHAMLKEQAGRNAAEQKNLSGTPEHRF
jgi:hypothetical protein